MKKILVFTRPWMTNFYQGILNHSAIKYFQQIYLTEFSKECDSLKSCNYINYNILAKTNYAYEFFSDQEIYDIIKRDRYLVTCNFNDALKYINTITEQLVNVYDKHKPDIVFGHLVDTYIFDIFYRIASKKRILQFSMVWGGIVNNTFKFYNYITPIQRVDLNQNVDLFKIMRSKREDISNPIIRKFDLDVRLKNQIQLIKTLLRVYNPFDKDFHNIYYEFRRSGVVALPKFNLKDLNSNYYLDFSQVPHENSKNKIYISLHYVPEATLNNFCKDNSLVNHDQIILDIVKKYNKEFIFIVKEHPAMYGKRDLSFYDELKKVNNLYFIHPSFKYYEILENVDYVLSWGGTVGIEAPFFGVKPINITKPYYYIEGYENYFKNYTDIMENFAQKVKSLDYDDEVYCGKLNNYFQSILFNGTASEKYNTSENLESIGKEIDNLLQNIYKLI
jgi:hypothetical protein